MAVFKNVSYPITKGAGGLKILLSKASPVIVYKKVCMVCTNITT